MIMAASLEVGKLVAASFLYRYWHLITGVLRFYLTLAVLVLIAITSLVAAIRSRQSLRRRT